MENLEWKSDKKKFLAHRGLLGNGILLGKNLSFGNIIS